VSSQTISEIKDLVDQIIPFFKKTIFSSFHAVAGSHGLNKESIYELFSTGLFRKFDPIWELGFGTGMLACYASFHTCGKVIATDSHPEVFSQVTFRMKHLQESKFGDENLSVMHHMLSEKRKTDGNGESNEQNIDPNKSNKKRVIIQDD